MRSAVTFRSKPISTARTPIGRAYRGAFNALPSPTLASHAIRAAVERAKIDGAEVQDVVMGAALQQGVQGGNIARTSLLRAGLPVTVSGQSIDRQCSSGVMAIATAAKQIIVDGMDVAIGGGVESISMVQTPQMRVGGDPELLAIHKTIYMPMLQTAEIVGKRYGIGREECDEYSLKSQQRTAAAQAAGKFDDEIVAVTATMNVVNKETKEVTQKEVTLAKDEGNRADTTLEGLQSLKPVLEGGIVTAGNASQLSDGASASVLMEEKLAAARGLTPLGRYVGMAVAGTEPDEMGIGPVFAIPKLLERTGTEDGRYRPVGAKRGVRGAGAVLPRQARHSRRAVERQRWLDLDRPSLWHDRRALHGPRAHRGQAPGREICRRDDVRRRRHGRRWPVRSAVRPRARQVAHPWGATCSVRPVRSPAPPGSRGRRSTR